MADSVESRGNGLYKFKINGATHNPAPTELIYHDGLYYSGHTSRLIGE